jgi:glycosyltransferase involved in cell wall biosynthesis
MKRISFIMPPIRGGGPRNVYTLQKLITLNNMESQIISPYCDYNNTLPSDVKEFKCPKGFISRINKKISRFDRVSYYNFPMFWLKNYIFNPFSMRKYDDTDCYISTAWQTVYSGKIISERNNRPLLYFVQAYETSFGTNKLYKKLAENTYKMKIPMFTQSRWIKEYFKDKFSEYVEWIGLGIDHNRFFQNGFKKNSQVFTIARPEFDKGFDIFVEAMNIIWNKRKDLKILIAGSSNSLTGANIKFKYEFLDWVQDDNTLSKLYSESIFVNTGRSEAIPMPPLEAMACGSSVVISDIPGAREYTLNNKNCLVCKTDSPEDFADKIEILLDDHELREKLGESAIKTSMNYDWKFVIQRFYHFLDKNEVCPK